jgi:hypothetical protein
MDAGLLIKQERERAEKYRADAIRINAQHCPCCGARLHEGKCWYGCLNPDAMANAATIGAAIIAAYQLRAEYDDEESSGNAMREEADYYRHPD